MALHEKVSERCLAEDLTVYEREKMLLHADSIVQHAESQGKGNAAMMIDPVNNAEVARAVDTSSGHPLHHAVMQCLQAVATTHLARSHQADRLGHDVPADGAPNKRCRTCQGDGANKEAGSAANGCKSETATTRHCVSKAEIAGQDKSDMPYLCTGYDCYMIQEPCVMCAMALTHSRVRRVVYIKCDKAMGALGGAFRLHSQASLNHHLQVFQICSDEDV